MSGIINSIGSAAGINSGTFGSILSNETATGLLTAVTSLIPGGGMPTTSMYLGLDDVAPDFMWTADIVNIGSGTGNSSLPALSNVYIREIQFGYNRFDFEQRYRNGIYQTFPRHMSAQPCTLNFYEPYNYSITYYLNQWLLLIRNAQGHYGLPSTYMGSIIIRLYDYTGFQQMAAQLDGVWPMDITGSQYQYQSSQPVSTACQFSVNSCSIIYIGTGFSTFLSTSNISTDLLQFGGGLANNLSGGIIQLL
jgi:hypothetical protein